MKSFLASLTARAHGIAEVVQPRPRALFEPDAAGGENAAAKVDHVSVTAPVRAASLPEVSRAEPRLGARVVEIERLLAATPTVVAGTAETGHPVTPVTPVPVEPPAPAKLVVEVPVPVAAHRPADAPVIRPAVQLHRAEPVPGALPAAFNPVPPAAPATPPALPSVTIRIERVDVRAVVPATPVSRPAPPRRNAPGRSSLDDYLATRR